VTAERWLRGLRDLTATLCGGFLFIYGGLTVRDATVLAVMFGAAGTLLGLPGAWWLDRQREP